MLLRLRAPPTGAKSYINDKMIWHDIWWRMIRVLWSSGVWTVWSCLLMILSDTSTVHSDSLLHVYQVQINFILAAKYSAQSLRSCKYIQRNSCNGSWRYWEECSRLWKQPDGQPWKQSASSRFFSDVQRCSKLSSVSTGYTVAARSLPIAFPVKNSISRSTLTVVWLPVFAQCVWESIQSSVCYWCFVFQLSWWRETLIRPIQASSTFCLAWSPYNALVWISPHHREWSYWRALFSTASLRFCPFLTWRFW